MSAIPFADASAFDLALDGKRGPRVLLPDRRTTAPRGHSFKRAERNRREKTRRPLAHVPKLDGRTRKSRALVFPPMR